MADLLVDGAPLPSFVVMGVQGSGKSTVGARLAERLGLGFLDADDLHPEANRSKMASGIPLDDADREPWLHEVGRALAAAEGAVVCACSALRRGYRDLLREWVPHLVFVHLDGSRELLAARVAARGGHFMPPALLDSQLSTLERLEGDELGRRLDIVDEVEDLVDAIVVELDLPSRDSPAPDERHPTPAPDSGTAHRRPQTQQDGAAERRAEETS